jgi:hypothetical protein
MKSFTSRMLSIVLASALSGIAEPAILLAQQTPAPQSQPQSSTPSTAQQPASPATADQESADREQEQRQQQQDKASQELINGTRQTGTELPESPDTVRAREAAQQNARQQIAPVEPSGTAAAQEGKPAGNIASRPAGAAIAPAKQRQVRSFLIKLGVLAGAGAALGTVYALSRASGPTPPGAR